MSSTVHGHREVISNKVTSWVSFSMARIQTWASEEPTLQQTSLSPHKLTELYRTKLKTWNWTACLYDKLAFSPLDATATTDCGDIHICC